MVAFGMIASDAANHGTRSLLGSVHFRWYFVATTAWLVLLLSGLRVLAADLVSGPEVRLDGSDSAIVSWATDVPTKGVVRYGLFLERLDLRAEGPVTNRHAIRLENLRQGSTYHYLISTARQPLATNSFSATTSAPSTTRSSEISASKKGAHSDGLEPVKTPPAKETWGNLPSLQDHFDRHGSDFGAKTPEEYAGLAWKFLRRAREAGFSAKIDETGVIRVFDRKTGEFGAYNRDGTTRTYFKPNSASYFERQPGKLTKLQRAQ
jgi:hypothetical protein